MDVKALDRNYKRFALATHVVALAIVVVYGVCIAGPGRRWAGCAAALLTALAPLALGGFFGFLFGLPKTLQDAANGTVVHKSAPNTNLEQVSDWLTKILIGVSLTQLTQIPTELQDTGEYVASAIGPTAAPSIVAAIIIVFAISGFTIAYLITKFDLSLAIDLADDVLEQLGESAAKNPTDRRAVEHFVYGVLYAPAPEGFTRAIKASKTFLSREGHPTSSDGDLFGYLTCALGQKYRYRKDHGAKSDELDSIKAEVLKDAAEAIQRMPSWKADFRQVTNPPEGSTDNDLEALKDDVDLRKLLDIA